MNWEAWFTLALIGLMVAAMLRHMAGPDTVMLGGLTVLMVMRVVSQQWLGRTESGFPTPEQAFAGFASKAPVTIGVLFVVAEGLRQTGAMSWLTQRILGQPKSTASAQCRLMLPVAGLSAFLNNTPIVAMFMPVVSDWCKRTGVSPSKLFIPLSYAAILGGTCTLIGTATNVLVEGMVSQAVDAHLLPRMQIGMFTNTWVGLPAALAGIGLILLTSRWLLPDHRASAVEMVSARQYTVEMKVQLNSPIVGKTIEQAGLRRLAGVYLMAIERAGKEIMGVSPNEVLRGDDRLVFVGLVDSVVDLQKIRGLTPATNQVFKLDAPRPDRRLFEAVVSEDCPLIGKTIREGRFRGVYQAVVIAVHRAGVEIKQKIGDIVLKPGDTLLLEAKPDFADQHRHHRDFYLVSSVADSQPVRHDKAWVALTILVAMVLSVVLIGGAQLIVVALVAGGLMIVTRCCSPSEARASINWRVLLLIGAALGVGRVLERTGAAEHLADQLVTLMTPIGPVAILAAIYLIAMILSSLIGPVGAVTLLFPIAVNVVNAEGYNFMPFAMTLMMTAATSFATPMGYQTNMMVYGPGGYKFSDFVKIGLPLNFCTMAVTLMLAPMIWPMTG